MKMLLIVADAARLEAIRRDLQELGAAGYTAFPVIEGSGRTGVHAGDRVHPGALVTLLVAETSERADRLFDRLAERRNAAGDTITRLFLAPLERQA